MTVERCALVADTLVYVATTWSASTLARLAYPLVEGAPYFPHQAVRQARIRRGPEFGFPLLVTRIPTRYKT